MSKEFFGTNYIEIDLFSRNTHESVSKTVRDFTQCNTIELLTSKGKIFLFTNASDTFWSRIDTQV